MASAKTCDTCFTRSFTSVPRIGSRLENLMAVLMLRQPPGSCSAQASSAAPCTKSRQNRGHPLFSGLFRKVGEGNRLQATATLTAARRGPRSDLRYGGCPESSLGGEIGDTHYFPDCSRKVGVPNCSLTSGWRAGVGVARRAGSRRGGHAAGPGPPGQVRPARLIGQCRARSAGRQVAAQ